ncbi:hypothetical protein VTK56DRAFT_8516 [Thermocarpiscus australiensis]
MFGHPAFHALRRHGGASLLPRSAMEGPPLSQPSTVRVGLAQSKIQVSPVEVWFKCSAIRPQQVHPLCSVGLRPFKFADYNYIIPPASRAKLSSVGSISILEVVG